MSKYLPSYSTFRKAYSTASALSSLRRRRPSSFTGRANRARLLRKGLTALRRRTRTRTTTRRKLNQRALNLGTGGSFSKFFYGKRLLNPTLRTLYKKTNKNYWTVSDSSTIECSTGFQDFITPLTLFRHADLETLMGMMPQTTNNTNRVNFESASAELQISNMRNSNTRVVIYDIIARRDTDDGYITLPEDALNAAITNQGGAGDKTDFGISPFTLDVFTQYFKVLKMTHVLLSEGQTHIHRVHYAPNKVLSEQVVKNTDSNIRGLSCFTMIHTFGTPCNDYDTHTTITSTSVRLDIVWKKTYRFGFISNEYTRLELNNNLPHSVTYDVMDIAKGETAQEAEA